MSHVVVIGGGIGGLTTAALLARAGLEVTVLEAHVYAGGCAGTFYHQGYRFDSGTTLPAGLYPGGPMDIVAQAVGIDRWPVRRDDPAMAVHLPVGTTVTRYGGEQRWGERLRAFGSDAEPFWHWQETTSDALWELALRLPTWPLQRPSEMTALFSDGLAWLGEDLRQRLKPGLALDAVRPVAAHLRGASERLRLFVDVPDRVLSPARGGSRRSGAARDRPPRPRRGLCYRGRQGSTCYGIGAALARISDAILKDQRAILTICTPVAEIAGVCDVTISLPHLLGVEGAVAGFPLPLSTDEEAQLEASAQVVCDAIEELDAMAAA